MLDAAVRWSVDDHDELIVESIMTHENGIEKRDIIHIAPPGTPARVLKYQYLNALRRRMDADERRSGLDRRFAMRIDSSERRKI